MRLLRVGSIVLLPLLVLVLFGHSLAQPRPVALAGCGPPPTPEPFYVDPVTSPTTLLTQTIGARLGMGRAITATSEAGTVAITGTFSALIPVSATVPLLPNTTHHLTITGLVEYAPGCFYTLYTTQDRNGNPLTIVQVSNHIYLPIVLRNFGDPSLAGCAVFPPDNPRNADISNYPVHPNSDNFIADINLHPNKFLHADFGSNPAYGIPYTIVASTQPNVPINFVAYPDESDPGPYPIPPDAPIEGGPGSTGDRHVLVLEKDSGLKPPDGCILYELYRAFYIGPHWNADSGAKWNLNSNVLRPLGWTSADAAGLPILPGLVRYDEVEAGAIRHALRFTVWRTQRGFILPATHFASDSTDPNRPPMGLRLRLKASYDVSGFTGQARVILEALKRYGMIVADNGSSWFITGAPDPRWDDEDLDQLKSVPGSAFEAVYTGEIITNP